MTIVYALAAALANALNVVSQHRASTSGKAGRVRGWQVIALLFRSPMWLAGWVALAAAFVFQALALHRGQLSVVQPLLVTELVFALVLRWLWVGQRIRAVTWWAAAGTSAGLALFLLAAEPQGGTTTPTATAWVSVSAVAAVTAGLFFVVGRMGGANRRAVLYGSATAVLWAVVAMFIKATTDSFADHGMGAFGKWPVYALAVSGLVAEVMNQATLHAGPLSRSQPFLVIVDPLASIAFSVWVYGEHFTPNAAALVLGTASFIGMCAGVALLIRTAPATMEPEVAR